MMINEDALVVALKQLSNDQMKSNTNTLNLIEQIISHIDKLQNRVAALEAQIFIMRLLLPNAPKE